MMTRVLTMMALLSTLCFASMGAYADDKGKENMKAYQELFELSMKEKKGIMFYVNGQTIGGAVTKINDAGFVEVRNQTYGRIVIRVGQIDAVGAN